MQRRTWRDSGATDPILVIAAIAVSLILLVGGSFAVAGLLANSRDLNARQDLDRLATAQQASAAKRGGFTSYDSSTATTQGDDLSITPSASVYTVANACGNGQGWYAATRSTTGKVFLRTSASTATSEAPGTGLRLPSCASSADLASLAATAAAGRADNLLSNASFETGTRDPWLPNRGTLFTTSVPADGGALGPNYLRLAFTSASSGFGPGVYQYGLPVTAGTTYAASTSARSSSTTGTLAVRIEWFGANGAISDTGSASTALGSSWATKTGSGTAPAGATNATLTLYVDGSFQSGDTLDLDAVTFGPR
ncbi:carbohydrate binding domain-containing protein [Curtobacterium citreum]